MSYNPVNPNGQTTKANSTPVTLASDQNNALETGGNLDSISTNLTNGSQATKITDSLGNNANVIPLANYNPLAVGMVDGNGDQITSFGGGVQYTYGDVPDGTATGTLSMQVDTASGVAIPLLAVEGATKVSLVNSNDGSSFVGSKASSSSLPVVIASDQSTLPISGTVTANIGTADGISTSAIQTNGNQITQVKDASANALQVAQGSTTSGQTGPIVQTATTTSAPTYTTGKTNPLSTDTSGNLRTTISNASIPITSSGTLTVSDSSAGTTATNTTGLKDTVGTLSAGTAATKSLAVGGVYNSSAPTPTTGQQLSLQLDGSGNLKISGTVTANLGTIDGAATATGQTDGSQKTKIVDGSGNVIGATSNALDVNIKSGGSSGTQYTNNAVQATPTGTVALGYDGTNVRGLLTDDTGKLQTNITNSSLAVTGTVTANIGTMNGLALDATQTNGSQQTKLTDGTNIANVLKSDGTAAGQNAQLVAPAYKEVGSLTAGALNADLVPSTDVSGYSTFALQIAGTFSGTLTLQGSNDNTNFTPVYGTWANNSQPVSVMTNTGIISGSCNFRYFRVRMTAYTSGTATGTLELKTMPFAPTNIQVSGTVTTTPVTVKNTGNITTSSSSILSTSGNGYSWAYVTIHGTYSGISFGITASDDSGTTYYNVPVWDVQNNKYIAPGSTISPADNSSASFIVPQSSNGSIVRVLATAYTSGTGAVAISGQSNAPLMFSQAIQSFNSTASAVPTTALPVGFQARTTDITATTSTYNTIAVTDKVGKQVQLPYAIPELFVKGSASATGTSSTSLIAAGAAGIKNYITSISIANTGTSTSLITLQDGSGGATLLTTIAPAGGGSNITLPVPIATSAATALYFAAGTASTTIYLTAVGYTGV